MGVLVFKRGGRGEGGGDRKSVVVVGVGDRKGMWCGIGFDTLCRTWGGACPNDLGNVGGSIPWFGFRRGGMKVDGTWNLELETWGSMVGFSLEMVWKGGRGHEGRVVVDME